MSGTNTYEIPNGLRGLAETGLDQSRRAFGSFFAAARRNAEMMQGATAFARSSTMDMALRGLDYAEQNLHASLDHAQKLARSRDLREAMQVQTQFVRERVGAWQSQAREIGDLAQTRLQRGAAQAQGAAQESGRIHRKIAEQNQEAVRKVTETASEAAGAAH